MEKRKNAKFHIVCLIAVLAVFALAVWALGKLTQPKYQSGVLEGGMTQEYYSEKTDHDVIFIGDCEVYENFSPVTLWENYGINSYIRGSAQQLIWQSYYILEDTFKRESPKIVVYNVQAMHYSEPQSEAYNRMTLDGMPLSEQKLKAIEASKTDDEDMISYLIPLLRYHSRITELTAEDFEYWFSHDPVTISGYLMRADIKPMSKLPAAQVLDDYTIGENCFDYLDKMAKLCQSNGAKLVLIKSPSLWPHWYDEWDKQISDFAKAHELDYINLLPEIDSIGLDMQTDTYDAGLHLNVYGAEKLSKYFGKILSETYGAPDRRNDKDISAVWETKCKDYYALLNAQKAELEEYGYLKSWTLGDN